MNRRPSSDSATARNFWQSRMTRNGQRAPLPPLIDINELARQVRAAYRVSA